MFDAIILIRFLQSPCPSIRRKKMVKGITEKLITVCTARDHLLPKYQTIT